MTGTMTFLAGFLVFVFSAGPMVGLGSLMLEGPELHPTLETRELDESLVRHVPWSLLQSNPQHSTDPEFVRTIARSGSQGRLESTGIVSALYALYAGESDIGIYGLEAASPADADRLEQALRDIWARNASLERARVHRAGNILVVAWNMGLSPEVWEAVNAVVVERLTRGG